MSWLVRVSQRYEDTGYWGRNFLRSNPDFAGGMEVYQSPDFPHVFLGGEDDLEEAEAKAGQPICKTVDCRDLPEISAENPSWDYGFYSTVKFKFDQKVDYLANLIQSTNCPIFVYCAAGANRSVSVLASALSKLTNQSIDAILADMKSSRVVANPQDPYYLMALEESPGDAPESTQRRMLELDQDFPLIQPGLPTQALGMNWMQKVSAQKLLIMARGPSGSGKSHMTGELSQRYGVPSFSTDDYFMESGEYNFDPNHQEEFHKQNIKRTEEAMRGSQSVIIVDNTNIQFWEMKPYVQLAQRYGYVVDFKEPDWSPELRNSEGGWNVDFLGRMQNQPDREKTLPPEVLEQMVQNYQYNPSVESVLNSERPGRLVPQPKRDDELKEHAQ